MDARVASQATITRIDFGIVVRVCMARRAKHRVVRLQHGDTVRAVWVVAVAAIFGHGFMRVHKRTAFARVAGVARIVLILTL